MPRLLSALKNSLLTPGSRPRRIRTGLLKGTTFNIDLTSGMQIYMGIAEKELAPWFKRFAKNAKTAVDVGAAEGYYTLFFLTHPQITHVYAFEPSAECRNRLHANLQQNGFEGSDKLKLSTKLVGDTNDAQHSTLDALLGKISFPCIVKLDIEGAEWSALEGSKQLLERPDVSWIIEAHSEELESKCVSKLQSHGYQTQIINRSFLRLVLPELRPAAHNSWIVAYKHA